MLINVYLYIDNDNIIIVQDWVLLRSLVMALLVAAGWLLLLSLPRQTSECCGRANERPGSSACWASDTSRIYLTPGFKAKQDDDSLQGYFNQETRWGGSLQRQVLGAIWVLQIVSKRHIILVSVWWVPLGCLPQPVQTENQQQILGEMLISPTCLCHWTI